MDLFLFFIIMALGASVIGQLVLTSNVQIYETMGHMSVACFFIFCYFLMEQQVPPSLEWMIEPLVRAYEMHPLSADAP